MYVLYPNEFRKGKLLNVTFCTVTYLVGNIFVLSKLSRLSIGASPLVSLGFSAGNYKPNFRLSAKRKLWKHQRTDTVDKMSKGKIAIGIGER